MRRALFVPAALTAGAVLLLTACGPDDVTRAPKPATGTAAPAAPAAAPAAPSAPTPAASGPAAAPAAPAPATPARPGTTAGSTQGGGSAGGSGSGSGSGSAGGSNGGSDGDAYAYGHPCESKQLSVRMTVRPGANGNQRVIEVRNQGPRACGLSYYPLVSLGDSRSGDRSRDVRPLVPGGLGGAPAYPVGAGQTAYAVLDLNPSGAAAGAVPGIDQANVLADGDHMPNAETLNLPLGPGATVLKPRLGLYRSSVADAVVSAAAADRQP